jgi:hypothetical protein
MGFRGTVHVCMHSVLRCRDHGVDITVGGMKNEPESGKETLSGMYYY